MTKVWILERLALFCNSSLSIDGLKKNYLTLLGPISSEKPVFSNPATPPPSRQLFQGLPSQAPLEQAHTQHSTWGASPSIHVDVSVPTSPPSLSQALHESFCAHTAFSMHQNFSPPA